MADFELKTDEEKAEALKAWWSTHGMSVFAGIGLTFAGMFGWNHYQASQLEAAEGASRIFSQLNKEDANTSEIVEKLKDQYSGSVYTSLASLNAAKSSCESNNIDECVSLLKAASESSQESVATIAKVRLARTLISTGKLDEANTIISGTFPKAYDSLIQELNGDIHAAKNEYKQAREAYEQAIKSAEGQNTRLLQMKRDDLGDHLKSGA